MTRTARTARAARAATTVGAVVLTGALLVGCDQAGDAARGAADDAGCRAVGSALSGAKGTLDDAVDAVGADPQSAARQLKALRSAVTGAIASGISGDAKAQLQQAKRALDDLVGQAEEHAQGTPVDPDQLSGAKKNLGDALDGVSDAC